MTAAAAGPVACNSLPLRSSGGPLGPEERRAEVEAAAAALRGDDPVGAFIAWRRELIAQCALGRCWALAGRLAAATDAAVRLLADETAQALGLEAIPVAIVATGGYGRGCLLPYSDVDIALIAHDESAEGLDDFLRGLHRRMFDGFADRLRLAVGYQFRPIDDLRAIDHVTLTALLDARLVCGAESVFAAFLAARERRLDRAAFMLERLDECEARGLNRPEAVYALEPDLKADPGGFRDLEFALWIAEAATGGAVRDLAAVAGAGWGSPDEMTRVRAAVSALYDLRFALHRSADRKTDRLFISQHENVARALFGDATDGLDRMMALRMASAAEVHAFALGVREESDERPVPIGDSMELRARRVWPAGDVAVKPMEALLAYARTGAALSTRLKRRLVTASAREEAIEGGPLAADWLELLDSPRFGGALRIARDIGVTARWFPELQAATGQIPYDPSHEYAILEHSIQAVGHVLDLGERDGGPESALAKLWRGQTPAAKRSLVLAMWLHDMGKPLDRSDHSSAGARICHDVGKRLGLGAEETELAARLVELHLAMARRASFLDLDQDVTIREFADLVGDARTLNLLYLLTYADTKAVGARVLTNVELRNLEDLHARTLAVLAEEGMEAGDVAAAAERMAELAARELRIPNVSEERILEHCRQMPPLYVISTPLPVIASHIAMVRDLTRRDEPVIDCCNPEGDGYTEITVCCYDDPGPGLFSKIAGALFALGVNIHSAQIRTRYGRRVIVVDTLIVDIKGRALPEDVQQRVKDRLESVLLGRISLEELLIRVPRELPVQVVLDDVSARNDLSDDRTVIWVKAEDQPGLLYRMTRALAVCGLNLYTAKIATWGGRAENVFYVADRSGGQVPEEALEELVTRVRGVMLSPPSHPAGG